LNATTQLAWVEGYTSNWRVFSDYELALMRYAAAMSTLISPMFLMYTVRVPPL